MSNYKLKYSGEKIDEILTKADGMTEVGIATGETAGKVKLSDATDSESDASAGVAATPKAVSQLKEDLETLDKMNLRLSDSTNLFNPNVDSILYGAVLNTSAKDGSTVTNNNYFTISILLKKGDYTFKVSDSTDNRIVTALLDGGTFYGGWKNIENVQSVEVKLDKELTLKVSAPIRYLIGFTVFRTSDGTTLNLNSKNTFINNDVIENSSILIPNSELSYLLDYNLSAKNHVGYAYNIYGQYIQSNDRTATDKVLLKAGLNYKIESKSLHAICLFDRNEHFVKYIDTSGEQMYSIVPKVNCYIGVTSTSSDEIYITQIVNSKDSCTYFLKKNINTSKLNGKTLFNFGDSVSAGDGNNGVGYAELVARENGMVVTDYAKGGATLATNSGAWTNILAEISQATSETHINPDFILIDGGGNDLSHNVPIGEVTNIDTYTDESLDDTTFCGALEKAFYMLQTRYQDSLIIFITLHHMNERHALDDYYSNARLICHKWGVPIVDMWNEGELNTNIEYYRTTYTNNGDGTHPNEAGYLKYYVPRITKKLSELVS